MMKRESEEFTSRRAAVTSVNVSGEHDVSKSAVASVTLIADWGVEGDAHAGVTVQHLSRIKKDATAPNLRQVHLIHSELFDEVAAQGYTVAPGQMGENITTTGIDLLALPTGTVLTLGETARIALTGLRNPCFQIDSIEPGLMKQMLGRDERGDVVRKAGVMAVVISGGGVRPGDAITVTRPLGEHRPLAPV